MISLPTQVLEITGADAAAFAHAQFCNDVLALSDGHWQWNAWLSPQGRVRACFHLLRHDAHNIVLILRGGEAEWLCVELNRYVFRAKVRLRVANDKCLVAGADAAEAVAIAGALPEAFAIAGHAGITSFAIAYDPPRWLLLGAVKPSTGDGAALERWRLNDIRAGLPEIGAELRDRLLPQWIGLDRLGAVNVGKGCYPGQEIMARLHFKGGIKRSLYRLRWPGKAVFPPTTTLRGPDGAEAGAIVTAARDIDTGCVEALASLTVATVHAALEVESAPDCAIDVVEHYV